MFVELRLCCECDLRAVSKGIAFFVLARSAAQNKKTTRGTITLEGNVITGGYLYNTALLFNQLHKAYMSRQSKSV